jgi:hypothetical protein
MPPSALYASPISGRTIRVLLIEPGPPDAVIQCLLGDKNLDDGLIPYIAISYVWGPTTNPERIMCNGNVVQVTSNLYAFLHEYRRRGTAGGDMFPLWVDAICINQSNDEERTTQVRMMKDIYEQANAVVVWLGPGNPDNDNTDLKTLDAIHAPWKTHEGLRKCSAK